MDPSNPYNDPNRPTYPPQQQPQAYYPPIQGPYPQQGNPGVQNTSYSGYNPNNTIQYIPYAQQPQNPVYMPQTNNLAELDQGCFQCYKIVLYIYLVFGILGIASNFSVMAEYSNLVLVCIIAIILEVFLLAFIIVQLQAIQNRDIKKAKLALTGFVCYMFTMPIFNFGISYVILGYLDSQVTTNAIVAIVTFVICVLIGSIQVYQLLKRNQPQGEGYQNINNNVTQNNVTA